LIPRTYPLISVVMATFNGEQFVVEQLDSVFKQTFSNIEVIVVDDCSTDNTREILEQYQFHYSTMRVVINDTNLGYIKNFEKGMLLATGDFIAPCDQDDIWLPEKLEKLMAQIKDYPIIYSNSSLINEQGKDLNQKLSDVKRLTTFSTPLNYSIGNSAPGHAMLINRKVIEWAIPLPQSIPHDYWIGFVGTFSGSVKFIDESLILYRQHRSNVFGVTKVKNRKIQRKTIKNEEQFRTRLRMSLLFEKCPPYLKEKQIFFDLMRSYESFSLMNNFKRMLLFFAHSKEILAFKNRSVIRRWVYCIKMFYQIV